jgi:hypothetical protein
VAAATACAARCSALLQLLLLLLLPGGWLVSQPLRVLPATACSSSDSRG